jgi:putative nucleotidyltransferase with HDIG domain
MVRACRFASQLGFKIDENTQNLIKNDANLVSSISSERVSEELSKILISKNPSYGLNQLKELGLMKFLLPEVEKLSGITQPPAYHIYDVYDHTMSAIENTPDKLELRLAALLHDIAKPETRTDTLGEIHFYGHEDAGEPKVREILTRLKFPNETIEKVAKLVRYHLVDMNISDKGLRRLISRVGADSIYDLLELKKADKLASKPDRVDLWKLEQMKEKVAEQLSGIGAFSIKDLAIGGQDVMEILNIPPSPKVGQVLHKLFDAVLDNPELNNTADLMKLVKMGE